MSDVLAVAEHRRADLRDVSFELVTAGRELADAIGGELHLAVISGDVEGFAEELSLDGVDVIHTVDHGEEFTPEVYVQAVDALYGEVDPTAVLLPNSANGLDYAPAVAERLDLPLVADATGFEWDGALAATREMYGSKVETTVEVDSERVAVTIRPGEWPTTDRLGDVDVRALDFAPDESAARSSMTGFEEAGGGDVDVSDAEVLVSVGRGIGGAENVELVERLADALGATLSASRPVVDNGWLPANREVGQSGAVVSPEVYVAVGVSGAPQHVAGVRGAETIVAVNSDPNAPIFDVADYGVVGDLFDVVPALIEEFDG